MTEGTNDTHRPMDPSPPVPGVPEGTRGHDPIRCGCGAYYVEGAGWSHAHHSPDDQAVTAPTSEIAESEGTWPPG